MPKDAGVQPTRNIPQIVWFTGILIVQITSMRLKQAPVPLNQSSADHQASRWLKPNRDTLAAHLQAAFGE
jgi:hypothetical protein